MFDWNKFLESQPRSLFANYVMKLTPLSEYGIIFVKGPDAETFLQGQCTCDFTEQNQNKILLGAHCNAKGRMNSSFVAAKLDNETIGLRVHKSNIHFALQELKKYIVFSKAQINIAENIAIVGLIGGNASKLLSQLQFSYPEEGQYSVENQVTILNHNDEMTEIWLTQSSLKPLWLHMIDNCRVTDHKTWTLANIKRGVAEIREETREQFVPQELNYQLVGGVSFNKGCYTGQEIVARLHYKADLKKHMYRAQVQCIDEPRIGSSLHDIDSAKKIGKVLMATPTKEKNTYDMLVLCNDSSYENGGVTLDQDHTSENSPPELTWKSLPYAIS